MPGSTDEYRRKRDFGRTPEPPPDAPQAREGARVFVVHRHDASRLHYDLRLEMRGVLKSWAVPRGFSYDPSVKHLAVRTEDHPLEYEHFEGVIPKGEYGAGTMTIWDVGTYELLLPEDPDDIDEGKVNVHLRGRRLRGEWHLFRPTKGQENDWLLIKARDRYSRAGEEGALGGDLAGAREIPLPRSLKPMRPAVTSEPFSDPEWLFEAELEGLRASIHKRGDGVTLHAKERKGLADQLAVVTDAVRRMRAEEAVLDGVLVALDASGRPSLEELEAALSGHGETPVAFYAFDLLQHEQWDVRKVPLLDRKARLASILPDSTVLLYVDHVLARGEELAQTVAAGGLGGVVAKQVASPYVGGRSKAWRRIPITPPDASRKQTFDEALKSRPDSAAPHVEGVKFSNLRKVYWPETGQTKGELLAYYDQVAEYLLPYLVDRPCHLLRYPDGIEGKSFYQHEAPAHLPDWFETLDVPSESKGRSVPHMIVGDRPSLLCLVNLGSIDLHPWLSRRDTPDEADWIVIDLDAKQSTFEKIIRVARVTGKLLHELDLLFCMKTSGKTGLHLYVPLEPGYTYDQSCMFAEALARIVARDLPDIATVERDPEKRGDRVYVDAFQNRRGQTVVPPYVVRPVPGASVSTPITWDELDQDLSPQLFTMRNVLARLSQVGDLFRPTLERPQDLAKGIAALEAYLSR